MFRLWNEFGDIQISFQKNIVCLKHGRIGINTVCLAWLLHLFFMIRNKYCKFVYKRIAESISITGRLLCAR